MKMAAAQSPARKSREPGVPLLSVPSEKSGQSLPSPWSSAVPCAHPACDRALLSLAHGSVCSLQTQQIPTVHSQAAPGGGRSLPGSAACWGPPREQWPDCAADHGLWQTRAESPLLGSLFVANFTVLKPGSSATVRHPPIFL